ncbi:MAG: hypothetical protein LBO82_06615 [Synergistaceae bacterium]|jgi:DNA anti-recombination protein RmuC|nr:hypothetical protein [Synergistaceae bacterium]
MANGTAAAEIAATRGIQRETFPVSITPVDEKLFESEIRRTDAAVSEEKRNREKFETRIEKAVDNMRGDMNTRFEKTDSEIKDLRGEMYTRFDKMEKSVDSRFDKMEKSVNSRFDEMEKSVNSRFDKMENSVALRFEKMDGEIKRLDNRLWWIFGAIVFSILLPIAMKYL